MILPAFVWRNCSLRPKIRKFLDHLVLRPLLTNVNHVSVTVASCRRLRRQICYRIRERIDAPANASNPDVSSGSFEWSDKGNTFS